jgi:hypothetical protein
VIGLGLLKVTKIPHLDNLINSNSEQRFGSWWGLRGFLGNLATYVDRPVVAVVSNKTSEKGYGWPGKFERSRDIYILEFRQREDR